MYAGVLSKKELEREIKIRSGLLDEYEKGTKENRKKMIQNNLPYIDICAIDRMIQIIKMEKETLKGLEKEINH